MERLTYKYEQSEGYGSVRLKHLPNDPFVDKIHILDDAWEEQRNKLGQLEDLLEKYGVEDLERLEMILREASESKMSSKDVEELRKRFGR